MSLRVIAVLLAFSSRSVLGLDDRPECVLWSKLENKTVPLHSQGHANCTTNPDCTGFNCVGIYQDQPMSFGMRVLPCEAEPGVELFGNAPQFSSKNFSHVFSHEDEYEIPSAVLNTTILTPMMAQMPHLEGLSSSLKGRMSVSLKMDHSRNMMIMGLSLEACVNETCIIKMPIFNDSEIPVPPCHPRPSLQSKPLINSVCNVNDISSCGENQQCEQDHPGSSEGICQCQQGFSSEADRTCKPVQDEKPSSEIKLDVDNDVENKRDKKATAADSANQPQPQGAESATGGSIAAAVISVIVVVVLLVGAGFYIVMRTRLVPRIRARMTNTPYECANLSQPPQAGPTLP